MMKRAGWVSNSSSSSFLIYGVILEEQDFERVGVEGDSWAWRQYAHDHGVEIQAFQAYGEWESDEVFLGRSWDTVGDDETGAEFKKDVDDKVSKLLGKTCVGGTYDRAWYNG